MTDQNCTCNGGRPCYHCSIAAPLNPDALQAASRAIDPEAWEVVDKHRGDPGAERLRASLTSEATAQVSAYLAVALPEVTGEQVNLAGWTCNGVHEPGDYSACEECRDACDDLARFYNHMMQNPRTFKHWTGHPEVNDV